MKIRIAYVGRSRNRALNAAAAEYARRLGHFCDFGQRELREADLARVHQKFPRAMLVAVDAAGRRMDSAAFTRWLERLRNGGTRELVFLVGGADGLPPALRAGCELLSLSPLTLPHELARVVLLEQIYRAFATLHNHPYPR